jgi:penicillin-binding protein 1A
MPWRWIRWTVMALLVMVVVVGLGVAASAFWVLTILPGSLPSVSQLERFDASEGTKVYDDNDELITEFHVERRIFVPLAQIPKALREAIIATEDARFYSHYGVDPMGIGRAVYQNFRRGRVVEGGSTITQQLAKVLFLTPDRARRLKEAISPGDRAALSRRILEHPEPGLLWQAYGVERHSDLLGKSVSS